MRDMSRTKDIRQAVEDELTFDPLVDATDTKVVNMNGDVALNGTVPSYPQVSGLIRQCLAQPR
jgi:osmotically-inducible protein OsmY